MKKDEKDENAQEQETPEQVSNAELIITSDGGLLAPVRSGKIVKMTVEAFYKDENQIRVKVNGGNLITTPHFIVTAEDQDEDISVPFTFEELKRITNDIFSPYSPFDLYDSKFQKWTYQDVAVEKETFHFTDKAFTYVLITKTPDTPSRYIGFKKFDSRGDWLTYLGSNDRLKTWIKENGGQNIRRKILSVREDEDEARYDEEWLLEFFNTRSSPTFFNQPTFGRK